MPLEIRIADEKEAARNGRLRVALEGSLDSATSPQLEKELERRLAGPVHLLVLDLAGLKFMSSAGIRVLMTARQTLSDRQGSFAMTNLQPQIAKVIEIVKSLPGISIFRNDAEMDAYLAAMQKKIVEGGREQDPS